MILFQEDWLKYPGAIADYNTSNRSFVDIAMLLRDLGVKNHLFPLALINPRLQGIDPRDHTLPQDVIAMIVAEIKINPWYFIREVLRAPARSGFNSVPVEANRSNIALWWCFLNHIDIILTQPRQTGKSFNTDGIMVWLLCFATANTNINLLTKDDTLRRENVARLKEMIELIPPHLSLKDKNDANNGEMLTIKALGNKYITHVPQASPKRANNMGRGLTTAVLHIDEPPFQPNIDIALPAILAAMSAAIDQAKANDAPYGRIYTTTAGRKDDASGKYFYSIVRSAATWKEAYLDAKDSEEARRLVEQDSPEGKCLVYAVFSHKQLGKTDGWLKEILSTMPITSAADKIKMNMDYFNIWSSGTESSPFSPDISKSIASNQKEPDYKRFESIGNLVTNWYIPSNSINAYLSSKKAILGLDTSDAVGKDDIGFVVTDVETLKVICTGKFNHINLIEFSKFIAEFLVACPNITAIIERKSSGTYILDYLMVYLPQYGINPFERLFNKVVQEASENPDRFNEIRGNNGFDPRVIERHKGSFGYATSGSGTYTRDALYGNNFQVALDRSHDRLYDIDLSKQLLSLKVRNGRIDHEIGEHDDMVIAWLLTNWLMLNGKNLNYYGIDSSKIYSLGRIGGSRDGQDKEITPEELDEYLEQQHIRERMVALYQELEEEENDFIAFKIEQELRVLDKHLIMRENEDVYSLDNLINMAKEKKKRRQQEAYLDDRRVIRYDNDNYRYGNNARYDNYSYYQGRY